MSDVPFFFAVPFRGKEASHDWVKSQNLLKATLRSIFAQTDPDFHVLLACHEVPDLPEIEDSRVTVLQAETPPPIDLPGQMRDKGHKRKMMSVELGRCGGGYFMLTDADDLVSRRLVAHVRSASSEYGELIRQGYLYETGTERCRLLRAFHKRCGTSAVLRFAPEDMPRSLDDTAPRLSGEYRMHTTFEQDARRLGRPLATVPFPAAMYIMGHGENYTTAANAGKTPALQPVRDLINKARSKRVSNDLAAEFAFSAENYR